MVAAALAAPPPVDLVSLPKRETECFATAMMVKAGLRYGKRIPVRTKLHMRHDGCGSVRPSEPEGTVSMGDGQVISTTRTPAWR